MRRDVAKPLVDLNKGPQKAYPKVRIGRPETVDTDKWMANVKTFVSLGGKVGMSTVRDKLAIPDPDEDEELLGAPSTSEQQQSPPEPTAPAKKPAAKDKTALQFDATQQGRDAIDAATAAALDDDGWVPLVAPIINGLDVQLANAASPEEARRILADRYRTMDQSVLVDMLAKLTFSARLAGEYGEDLS